MPRQPPLPPEQLSADGRRFYTLLNEAQDVSMIVVAVGYLDACLASLLAKHFQKGSVSDGLLDSRTGPLGSFSARARLAYALGLIAKSMYQDLQVLAELRNEVAHHHFALEFSEPSVSSQCDQLRYVAELKDATSGQIIFQSTWLSTPRGTFMVTALMIAQRLLLTALGTAHAKPQAS